MCLPIPFDRRELLRRAGGGLGAAAMLMLEGHSDASPATVNTPVRPNDDLRVRSPHIEPRARAVIQLFMNGGPSQMDLFDPKPELTRQHGKSFFKKIAGDVENPTEAGALMRSPFRFRQHGQSGMWVSEVMPYLAQCADDLTLVRSLSTTNLTHEPAIWQIQSGRALPGLPTMGAWVTYALGSENSNLPAYVVLDDPKGLPVNGTQNWQSGFLPPMFQGTRFRSTGSPVLNLNRGYQEPDAVTATGRSVIAELDRIHRQQRPGNPKLDARIASYELAARMQLAATDALDMSQESSATLSMYGMDAPTTESYGRRCLIARRLVERGVRFVQLFIDGQIWDNHASISKELPVACSRTDKPVAALIKDLKQRGLLDQTLVLWGGEMGRLPIAQLRGEKQGATAGRDHNKNAMVALMAGGGTRPGFTYGGTDELGFAAAENRIGMPDWHATVLHLLGLDHDRLTFARNGLNEKLTGVAEARVVRELIS